MMGKRSTRVSVCFGVALTVFAAAPRSLNARTSGYLPGLGPAPLRFQTTAPLPAGPPPPESNAMAAPVAPAEPSPAMTPVNPANSPPAGPGVPDVLKSLVRSPLWAALCEGLILNPAPLVDAGISPTQFPTPKASPVVTAEMLVEFFRPGEPLTNASPHSPLAPVSFTPPTLLVVPSSRATYLSQ